MDVYRICRDRFRALDGEGARLYGGRWNTPGRAVVYTSGTLALAALEYLIHVQPATAPGDLVALRISLPDDVSIDLLDFGTLPNGWARDPECIRCKAVGDSWAATGGSLALRVPAAPVPEEFNVLLNVAHEAMARVRVVGTRPFSFDPRLF